MLLPLFSSHMFETKSALQIRAADVAQTVAEDKDRVQRDQKVYIDT